MTDSLKLPRFLLIKQTIENHISSGSWPVGTRVPSENDLAASFSVSRMTARRALTELDKEGLLTRTPGLGSFVAKPPAVIPNVELPNVVQDIQNIGIYSCRILTLETIQADMATAKKMRVEVDDELYKGIFVHLDSQNPVQFEEIVVNAKLAPAFLKQNYNKVTAENYLNWVIAPSHTEYRVSAVQASAAQRRELKLTHDGEGICIKVTKRHWIQKTVLSISTLINPAEKFHLGQQIQ
ncbi:MAG: GntR family histidine utilization transcriptional repressor [Porticoccaceae bacterium]|jgi:GntR family histidine utilization transcriptional repressor